MLRMNAAYISSDTEYLEDTTMALVKRSLFAVVLCIEMLGLNSNAHGAEIRIGIADHTVSQVALYVARDKGYYAGEGLVVQPVLMSGAVANLALIGGNVEFTTVPTGGLTAALRGAPLRILSTTFSRPVWLLFSRPDITDIKTLKGKRIGTGGFGSATDILLRELLIKHSLQAGRDVVLVNLGSTSARLNALISGAVDAAVLPIPFNFSAQEAGFRELLSFSNQGLTLLTGSIVARTKTLETESVLVDKFIKATLKGLLYVRDNRPGTIPVLARNTHIKEDLAAKIYDLVRPAMAEDGTVNDETQKRIIAGIADLRDVTNVPAADKFFDFSSIRKAAAELRKAGWNPAQ